MRVAGKVPSADFQILVVKSDSDFAVARELFQEYARDLGVDLCFQNFSRELESIDTLYAAPVGRLLLAQAGLHFVGCVGVKHWSDSQCEMKRLYVQPAARGTGLGRRLALAAVAAARELGYSTMLLDTLVSMSAARNLYRSLGFVETAAYYPNPLPEVMYMKLDLRDIRAAKSG